MLPCFVGREKQQNAASDAHLILVFAAQRCVLLLPAAQY
jgi:hypothetical protein